MSDERRDLSPEGIRRRHRTGARLMRARLAGLFNRLPSNLGTSALYGRRRSVERRLVVAGAELERLRRLVYGDFTSAPDPEVLADRIEADELEAASDAALDSNLTANALLTPLDGVEEPLDPLEELSSYDKTDPAGRFTFPDPQAVAGYCYQNEVAHVSRDFGAGHFTDYAGQESTLRLTANVAASFCVAAFGATATLADNVFASGQDIAGPFGVYTSGYKIRLRRYLSGTMVASDSLDVPVSTDRFLRQVRTGSTVVLSVYSDAARLPGSLLAALTINDGGVARRFAIAAATRNDGSPRAIAGVFSDWDLGEAVARVGDVFGRVGSAVGSSIIKRGAK